ncbi:glutamine synthetase [Candidatus Poribacteria bacterium]|nr:glutamine synthetase [Candidatus Poribacteria bacterium]
MSVRGTLTLDELRERVGAGTITQVLSVFPDCYGRLVGKRIDAEFFVEHVAEHGMHACDYLLAVDMEMDPVPGYELTSWETGYGDFLAAPDWRTLRVASWLERTAIVLCDLVDEKRDQPVSVAPRSILRAQLERAAQIGIEAVGGSELEFYLFDETYRDARAKRYEGIERAGWYIEDYHIFQGTKEDDVIGAIREHLSRSGIPVEFSKGEWGPGQQEINVRYAEMLEMADRHSLYKHIAREVAWQRGKSVTFMAKWSAQEAGSSCHMHLSLWRDGVNLFADGSDAFRAFVGGLLEHAAEMTLFLAPTVNSYKRYQPGTFAPTAITWASDNRTAAFRVVGYGASQRIECRLPGADVNPYLAYAALLAAGLDGMARGLDPGELFVGDAYRAESLPRVPTSLRDAIALAERSGFFRQALGDDVMNHYLHFARVEQQAYDRAVTDWERIRYFERI